MEACVLLGDVVGSRGLSNRAVFGTTLETACRSVDEAFADAVIAPATPLKGVDEVGVVLEDWRVVYDVVRRFYEAVHPVRVRFAAVAGDIDVGVGSGRVPAMDGPAFHRADEMLASVADADLLFDLAVSESTLDRAIADEVNLLLRWRAGLTERQAEYVRAYERRGTQAAAAADLGVTQQAVSNELRDAGWPFVDRIERRLGRTLEEYADAK
jgi:hypothetical protein